MDIILVTGQVIHDVIAVKRINIMLIEATRSLIVITYQSISTLKNTLTKPFCSVILTI